MNLLCAIGGGILGSGLMLAALWDSRPGADHPRANPHTTAVVERLTAESQSLRSQLWDMRTRALRAEDDRDDARIRADALRRAATGFALVEAAPGDRIAPQQLPLP